MLRATLRTFSGLLLLMGFLYAADWAVWRIRLAYGTGFSAVEISHVSIASLKGNKEEYYSDGVTTVVCSRSLFPLPGAGPLKEPCWWLRRHPQIVEHD